MRRQLAQCGRPAGLGLVQSLGAGDQSAGSGEFGDELGNRRVETHAPAFDKISEDAYLPAFETSMAIHMGEIEAIKSNPEAPTFENTIVALEDAGRALDRLPTTPLPLLSLPPLALLLRKRGSGTLRVVLRLLPVDRGGTALSPGSASTSWTAVATGLRRHSRRSRSSRVVGRARIGRWSSQRSRSSASASAEG